MPHIETRPHRHPVAGQPARASRAAARPAPSRSAACLVNAVCDALAPLGIVHIDKPLTPARVWAAIQAAKATGSPGRREGEPPVIPTAFDYVRAGSLRDALSVLAQGDGTKVLAGGHSLLPMMKFRLAQPPKLLDIAGLAELRGVEEYRKGARIGATTTYRELLESRAAARAVPAHRRMHREHRRPPGPEPRHDRRQPGPRRSGVRHAVGHARARRDLQPPLEARRAGRSRRESSSRGRSSPRSRTTSCCSTSCCRRCPAARARRT